MTDASGVPTSPDNIPTFNTSADAPSGLGFNTAMAQLQAILTNLKAGTLASGKILPAGINWTGAYPFVNADFAAAAALAVSKLAPGTNGNVLTTTGGVAVWGAGGSTTYRKTTAKVVNTTVAATDLLNGEITIGAGILGTTGILRLTAEGDYLQNSGATAGAPRFQLVLGGTTLLDTTNCGVGLGNSATRFPWRIQVTIRNLGSASVQSVYLTLGGGYANAVSDAAFGTVFATGEGTYNANAAGSGDNIATLAAEGWNSGAVNTALAQALVLNVINPSASASCETKLSGALVEII